MAAFSARLLKYFLLSAVISHGARALDFKMFRSFRASSDDSLTIDPNKVFAPMQSLEPKLSLTDAFAEIIQTLNHIETLPNCYRNAAQHLAYSCTVSDAFDGQASSEVTDKLKTVFAIQWSACEWQKNAGESMPLLCQPFLDPNTTPELTRRMDVIPCVNAMLHDQTNTNSLYTVYTNSKSITGTMCEAMRSEVDKDERLHLFETMMDHFHTMGLAINMSREELDKLSTQFHDIRIGTKNILVDMHKTQQKLQSQLQDTITESSRQFAEDLARLKLDFTDLLQIVDQVGRGFDEHRKMAAEAHDRSNALSTEATVSYESNLLALRQSMDNLISQFHFKGELLAQGIFQQVYNVTKDINVASSHVQQLTHHLDTELKAQVVKISKLNGQTAEFAERQNALQAQTLDNLTTITAEADRAKTAVQRMSQVIVEMEANLDKIHYVVQWFSSALGYWMYLGFWFIVVAVALIISFRGSGVPTVQVMTSTATLATVLSISFTFIISPWKYLVYIYEMFSCGNALSISILAVVGSGSLLCTLFACMWFRASQDTFTRDTEKQ